MYDIVGNMTTATLDTNILVAAFASKGASHALIFEELLASRFEMAVSVALLLEYEDVLTRPAMLKKFGTGAAEVRNALTLITALSRQVPIYFSVKPALPDPDDERVLECVTASQSQYLLTLNIKHFAEAAQRFGFQILSPGAFLNMLRRKN